MARERAVTAYGTDQLRRQIGAGQGRDAQWLRAQAHQGKTQVTAGPAEGEELEASSDDGSGFAQVTVRGSATGRDGWREPLTPMHVTCVLTRQADESWRVDDVELLALS